MKYVIGIYKITNLVNGKSYIGQSIHIKTRIKEHFWKATCKNDISYNSALHSAIRKYGEKNFDVEIVKECNVDDLDSLEVYYIKYYNTLAPSGYNILPGGQSYRVKLKPPKCCKDCGATISQQATYCKSCALKHQERKVNNIPTKYELALMIKNNGFSEVGRKFGVDGNSVKKWCKSYGIPYLKNELIKWYNEQIGIEDPIVEEKEKIDQRKQVKQIDPISGNIIAIHESAKAAAMSLGKNSNSHITEVCNDKLKQAYGYCWEYV